MKAGDFWESIYIAKRPAELSWTQSDPSASLDLIAECCPAPARIIDVGGGTSALAGQLLSKGYEVTVIDVSAAALRQAAAIVGSREGEVRWIQADVTAQPDLGPVDLWHDRALFHFLTRPEDRAAYARLLSRTVRPGGHAIIATFTPDGPGKCSGRDVIGYDGPALAAEVGSAFSLIRSVPETHLTPWGKPQEFQYSVFQRVA